MPWPTTVSHEAHLLLCGGKYLFSFYRMEIKDLKSHPPLSEPVGVGTEVFAGIPDLLGALRS